MNNVRRYSHIQQYIRDHFPDCDTREIAAHLGVSVEKVYSIADQMGVRKGSASTCLDTILTPRLELCTNGKTIIRELSHEELVVHTDKLVLELAREFVSCDDTEYEVWLCVPSAANCSTKAKTPQALAVGVCQKPGLRRKNERQRYELNPSSKA